MAEERRLVTVLFADVIGSTSLGETVDPEDLRALLSRFYGIAREVIAAHGGTLEKFIGDAVLAVFGLPRAFGDDAERALAASLELRDRVRADIKLGERLPIRLGVNTGEVVAARDTSAGDFLITGDPVNLAARLQQTAGAWSILCGERTVQAARGAFTFGPAIDVEVKGKAHAVRAMLLLGKAAAPAILRTPLIGRDRDLAQLELVARRVVEERRPFLVSIVAPAGTGKTRLLEEFLDRLPALAPEAGVAIAQCLPYGQRLTYWPLRGALFRLVGIPEDTPPSTARERIRAWIREAGIDAPERVADFLAATVGLGEAESTDRDGLFVAWRTTVEATARRQPLVLVFEDLHWSSDSLLDLVEFVMQPRGDAPVLMIALARPELLDRRPAWGGGRRNYVSLALAPLPDGAVAGVVEHLLGRHSPEIIARVVARAEGNPFYAGEIVRSILERVPSVDDADAVERALAALPDTVQATVLARLDLLAADERRMLQLGAVFGRAFRAAGVAAVAPELAPVIDGLADRLIERDLLRPSDTDRFTFRHILIREVAYQTLPRAERTRLHAAAGRWLEGQAGGREDSLAELVAFHYREAASLAAVLIENPAEQAEVRTKAVEWLRRAGEAAAAGAAFPEASRHLRAAIDLAAPDDLPDLYERYGDVTFTGGGNVAIEAYRTALRLAREHGRPADQELRILASFLMMSMRFQASVGDRPPLEEIKRFRVEGRALMSEARDQRAVTAFLVADAFFPFWRGAEATAEDLDDAERSARHALEVAERLDDPRLLSAALDATGSLAHERGNWPAAREAGLRRLGFQHRLDFVERIDAYSVVGWSSGVMGDLTEAERVTAASLAMVQPGQSTAWPLHAAAWRTYALMLLGRWDDAVEAGERARAFRQEMGGGSTGYAAHGFMAVLDVGRARGDVALADRYRDILDDIVRTFPAGTVFSRGIRPYLVPDFQALEDQIIRTFRTLPFSRPHYIERALALCTDHRYLSDDEVLQAILERALAHHLRVLEGQTRRALGLRRDDPAELDRAVRVFEEIGAAPYVARAMCERALLRGDEGELQAGMRALEVLGDLSHLGRVEAARSRAG